MQDLVKQHFDGKTVVIVTHDPMEAVRLGDAIYVLAQSEPGGPATLTPFNAASDDAPARAEQLYEALQSS